ncbi:hypothetical protein PPERSA_12407 [Pseudocohnilembus persalinus]|uniref:Uncharacterized protein n=1 Tax=Pseudocohnilembus persalinus TaxID=266149 RepID=A0A0V0QPH1_PSEPJ|nr:hypothetical protein PPERSA_12407 [Pseudocohnilembus persalinus]|eukprot:KRX03960.1 hypothetical protein PPERSA_12407 [Pseudocohnilembus persalinus]
MKIQKRPDNLNIVTKNLQINRKSLMEKSTPRFYIKANEEEDVQMKKLLNQADQKALNEGQSQIFEETITNQFKKNFNSSIKIKQKLQNNLLELRTPKKSQNSQDFKNVTFREKFIKNQVKKQVEKKEKEPKNIIQQNSQKQQLCEISQNYNSNNTNKNICQQSILQKQMVNREFSNFAQQSEEKQQILIYKDEIVQNPQKNSGQLGIEQNNSIIKIDQTQSLSKFQKQQIQEQKQKTEINNNNQQTNKNLLDFDEISFNSHIKVKKIGSQKNKLKPSVNQNNMAQMMCQNQIKENFNLQSITNSTQIDSLEFNKQLQKKLELDNNFNSNINLFKHNPKQENQILQINLEKNQSLKNQIIKQYTDLKDLLENKQNNEFLDLSQQQDIFYNDGKIQIDVKNQDNQDKLVEQIATSNSKQNDSKFWWRQVSENQNNITNIHIANDLEKIQNTTGNTKKENKKHIGINVNYVQKKRKDNNNNIDIKNQNNEESYNFAFNCQEKMLNSKKNTSEQQQFNNMNNKKIEANKNKFIEIHDYSIKQEYQNIKQKNTNLPQISQQRQLSYHFSCQNLDNQTKSQQSCSLHTKSNQINENSKIFQLNSQRMIQIQEQRQQRQNQNQLINLQKERENRSKELNSSKDSSQSLRSKKEFYSVFNSGKVSRNLNKNREISFKLLNDLENKQMKKTSSIKQNGQKSSFFENQVQKNDIQHQNYDNYFNDSQRNVKLYENLLKQNKQLSLQLSKEKQQYMDQSGNSYLQKQECASSLHLKNLQFLENKRVFSANEIQNQSSLKQNNNNQSLQNIFKLNKIQSNYQSPQREQLINKYYLKPSLHKIKPYSQHSEQLGGIKQNQQIQKNQQISYLENQLNKKQNKSQLNKNDGYIENFQNNQKKIKQFLKNNTQVQDLYDQDSYLDLNLEPQNFDSIKNMQNKQLNKRQLNIIKNNYYNESLVHSPSTNYTENI